MQLLGTVFSQVRVAQYWNVKGDSEKDDPVTTTRIYWCMGFGNTAETLSQQVTVKSIFQAIFNLAKKPPALSLEEKATLNQSVKAPTTTRAVDVPTESAPLPPLIQELLALAKASKPNHPSRKLPIINVLYEDPPPLEEEPKVKTNAFLTILLIVYF